MCPFIMLKNTGLGRKLVAIGLATALSGLGTAAMADTPLQTAFYPDPTIPNVPGPSFARFTIDVSATVGGSCGFATNAAPSGTVEAGAIDTTSWSGKAFFTPECTAPWRIAVSSKNGQLLSLATAPTTAFTNAAPYDVKLHVVHDSGAIDAQCAAADLTIANANCGFEGAASNSNGLQIPRSYLNTGSYIEATAPAYTGTQVLVAGAYQDVLTVTVSPAT